MHADQLADAAGGGGPGVGGGLDRADVAADDRGDQPGIHFLPAHEHDVRGLQHGVGGLDHADEAARLDHAERVAEGRFVVVPRCRPGFYHLYQPSRARSAVMCAT